MTCWPIRWTPPPRAPVKPEFLFGSGRIFISRAKNPAGPFWDVAREKNPAGPFRSVAREKILPGLLGVSRAEKIPGLLAGYGAREKKSWLAFQAPQA